ncbi:MAG: outer membrane beta-barrel protein [Acidobacteriota bacterium]
MSPRFLPPFTAAAPGGSFLPVRSSALDASTLSTLGRPERRAVGRSAARVLVFTLLCALAGFALASPVAAQQRGDVEVGGGPGILELDDKLGGDTGLALDARVGFFVTDRFQLELQHTSASSVLDGSFRATTLNALYYFGPSRRFLSPYGLLGAGRADVRLDNILGPDAADEATALRAALGVRMGLGSSDYAALRVELSALREDAFGDSATHLGLTVAFLWRFSSAAR